jgi:glycosyltransferase involved in cell wall biosynthesis
VRRIVHYYPDALGNSGVTFALWAWARAQLASGYEVAVLHGDAARHYTGPEFVSKAESPGLTVEHVTHRGRHRLLRHPLELERHLGRRDLLVLHEGWVFSNMAAAAAARRAGVPYVVMPHGVYDPAWLPYLKPPRWLRDRLERRVLEGAAAVHLFFQSEGPAVARLAPHASMLLAPTGYEVPAERWSGEGGYLAWLGRVDPYNKGLDVLVDAIALLPNESRPLLRVHGYDYKGGIGRLERLVSQRRMESWVRLGPALAGNEKLTFLQQASGFVLPSRWECHSIALLENLALGVPCVVSSVIHIAPELASARAAILAPPNEEPLARALLQVTSEGNELGERGRAFVADTLAWHVVMARYASELARLGLD